MEDYSNLEADAPQPRLCHLRKRHDFSGYGFNLHAEKGKSGHFIGKVDPDSPADVAGLREGDRIVEVNGTNIGMENHQQVVERIRAVSDETVFLVVDEETDEYYRERKVIISGSMPNICHVQVETPALEPLTAESNDAVVACYSGRLCKLRTWPDFIGYGFNLHAERGKEGQFIGKVDNGSPAEASGLKEGDRIIAINGQDVDEKTHSDVVQCIRAKIDHVDLLVVDMETNIKMENTGTKFTTSSVNSIETIECPLSNPHSTNGTVETTDVADEVEPAADAVVENNQINAVGEIITELPSSSNRHYARLCHVKSWPNGDGYGFSMQAERGKTGQFVGTVDPGSPADLAGLRFGDRIIEVNGSNIEGYSHKQVVEKIRERTDEVQLLVVDAEADNYFGSHDIKIYALMDSIKFIECPSSDPNQPVSAVRREKSSGKSVDEQSMANLTIQTSVNSDDAFVADYEQVTNEITELANSQSIDENEAVVSYAVTSSTTPSVYDTGMSPSLTSVAPTSTSPTVTSSTTHESVAVDTLRSTTSAANSRVFLPPSSSAPISTLMGQSTTDTATVAAATPPKSTPPKGPVVIGGVEFAASAEEARKRVVSKRDKNKKASSMSLKDKYALYQKL